MKFAALIRGTLHAGAGSQVFGLNCSSGNRESGGIPHRTEEFRTAGLSKRATRYQQSNHKNW